MKTLIVLLVVVIGIFIYTQNQGDAITVELAETGPIKHTNDFELRFTPKESLKGTFMIFGGHIDRKLQNSFSDYSLGALEINDAILLQQKYPDFHLCKSPGATIAQQKVRNLALIMENQQAADTVEDSISLHSERLAEDGERTCIKLHGTHLEPRSVELLANGVDISKEIMPKLHNVSYYLIDSAEIRDCRSLL
jgi:hypothetical protein